MSGQVVPVRLDRELIELIDLLIKLGVFNSRSEALRELIRAGIKELKSLPKVVETVERLLELERNEGDIPIRLEGVLRQMLSER